MTKKRLGLTAVLLSAMAFTSVGCGMMNSNGSQGTKMSAEEHKAKFPQGHERSQGRNCYYDRVNDTFLCEYK